MYPEVKRTEMSSKRCWALRASALRLPRFLLELVYATSDVLFEKDLPFAFLQDQTVAAFASLWSAFDNSKSFSFCLPH